MAGDARGIEEIAFYVRSHAGSGDIHLNGTAVEIEQGTVDATLRMRVTQRWAPSTTPLDPADGHGEFCVEDVTNPSGDGSPDRLSGGDLVKIRIFTDGDHRIGTNEDVEARIVLDSGATTDASFTTPVTMDGQRFKIVG